jgi:hypothetical protein
LLIEFINMLQRQVFRLARLSSAILLSGLLTCAHAVELGDTLMRSHIGQPLSADIELTGIVNETATVQVGLADPEVYRGANIAMHPALSSLNITIVRREGRRYLHIVSTKRVESEFVHIFFELTENGRRSVRQTTLWFTPDPDPAPPPAKVPAVPAALPAAPPAPAKVPAVAPEPRPVPAPIVAPAPIIAPLLRAAPAACVQQFTAAQIGTCAALDAKNAALSAQIVELEEKVRLLTVAMQAGAEPVSAQRPVAKAVPAELAPMKPMGAPARKAASATPWLLIGIASAAVLALLGVLFYILQRRAARVKSEVRVSLGFIASVKNRLMPGKKEPAPPIDPEPAEG